MSAIETADLLDQATNQLDLADNLLAFSTEHLSSTGGVLAAHFKLREALTSLASADLTAEAAEDWSGAGGIGGAEAKLSDATDALQAAAGESGQARAIGECIEQVEEAQSELTAVRATVAEYGEVRTALAAKLAECQEDVEKLHALLRKAFDDQMADAAQYAREAKASAQEIGEKLREAVA
mgnify:CR=1 FL=1